MIVSMELKCRFREGDIVEHRTRRYRGLVVQADTTCQAPHFTQLGLPEPSAGPWYHLLVDGGAHTSYVAERELALATDRSPVAHPDVPLFFDGPSLAGYTRNSAPWNWNW